MNESELPAGAKGHGLRCQTRFARLSFVILVSEVGDELVTCGN